MRTSIKLLAAAAAIGIAAPAVADDHGQAVDHSKHSASEHALHMVLAHERRADDRARDKYRNPGKTMKFFQVEPTHTVAEYAPGGGWYTRVIAPYVADQGKYVGLNFGPGGGVPAGFNERLLSFPTAFPAATAEKTGIAADKISAYIASEAPEELNGTVDRILIIRMLHNMLRWGIADSELLTMRKLLKDDGMVGVVQHSAPEGMVYSKTDGNRGYLKKSTVIALMETYGFELVGESFVNANPSDTADHPAGVWTLPPRLARGDEDKAKYEAIGESNRMTLLFKKAN